MRKWIMKSLALFDTDPPDTLYQRGFRDALIQVRNELDRRSEDRKILIAKSNVVAALAVILIGTLWALFT